MGVDGDDLFALAHPADDVAQPVDLHPVEGECFHLLPDALYHAALFTAFAGNGDHIPQEAGHIFPVALGRLFDGFKIHILLPP